MTLNTASATISFARKLEEDSGRFYEGLASKHGQESAYASFAEANRQFIARVEQAYYEVISDALEGTFAFSIDPASYDLSPVLVDRPHAEALDGAIAMEAKIGQFYSQAAEQSRPFMAEVARAFSTVARKREERREKLEGMRSSLSGEQANKKA